MSRTIIPCMGGWCGRRDACAHYHATAPHLRPAERLCAPGQDEPEPIKEPQRQEPDK